MILDPTGQLFQKDNIVIIEHFRQGKLLSRELTHNGIVTVGKNSLLDVYFRNQAQLANWYFSLIDNAGFTSLSASDTMSSHAGWVEFTTYNEATRPAWTPDAAASGSITNSTAVTFNITGSGTLYGMFVTSNNTKGGTTGTLWATAAFASTKSVVNNDQIKLTYTLNA